MIQDPPWIYGPPDDEPEDRLERDEEGEPGDRLHLIDFDPGEEKIWDAVRDYEKELERDPCY